MNTSCHTYEWVMFYIWMNHATHMNKVCHTHKSLMTSLMTNTSSSDLQIEWSLSLSLSLSLFLSQECHTSSQRCLPSWLSHVTHMSESCHKNDGVMSHMNASPFEWVMAHTWTSHVTHHFEPAMLTRLIQYLLPERSGKLCPKCVPVRDTVSPFLRHRTLSQTTSSSRKEGHPWTFDSFTNCSKDRPRGATKRAFPVTLS